MAQRHQGDATHACLGSPRNSPSFQANSLQVLPKAQRQKAQARNRRGEGADAVSRVDMNAEHKRTLLTSRPGAACGARRAPCHQQEFGRGKTTNEGVGGRQLLRAAPDQLTQQRCSTAGGRKERTGNTRLQRSRMAASERRLHPDGSAVPDPAGPDPIRNAAVSRAVVALCSIASGTATKSPVGIRGGLVNKDRKVDSEGGLTADHLLWDRLWVARC